MTSLVTPAGLLAPAGRYIPRIAVLRVAPSRTDWFPSGFASVDGPSPNGTALGCVCAVAAATAVVGNANAVKALESISTVTEFVVVLIATIKPRRPLI